MILFYLSSKCSNLSFTYIFHLFSLSDFVTSGCCLFQRCQQNPAFRSTGICEPTDRNTLRETQTWKWLLTTVWGPRVWKCTMQLDINIRVTSWACGLAYNVGVDSSLNQSSDRSIGSVSSLDTASVNSDFQDRSQDSIHNNLRHVAKWPIAYLFRPLSDRHHGLTTNDAIQLLVARPLYQNCHLWLIGGRSCRIKWMQGHGYSSFAFSLWFFVRPGKFETWEIYNPSR